MNTTENQESFILRFVHWLHANFEEIAPDQYRDIEQTATLVKENLRTCAECLDLFRKQQIPPLPELATKMGYSILSLAEETARRNKALFGGYQKINHLLATTDNVPKSAIASIIVDTMSQISNP